MIHTESRLQCFDSVFYLTDITDNNCKVIKSYTSKFPKKHAWLYILFG